MEKILLGVLRKLADGMTGPLVHGLVDELEAALGLTENAPAVPPAADPAPGAPAPADGAAPAPADGAAPAPEGAKK